MPHVNIKHFPFLNEAQQEMLASEITKVITRVIQCHEDVVSIALEEINPESWDEQVYQPEIVGRRELLCKLPNY